MAYGDGQVVDGPPERVGGIFARQRQPCRKTAADEGAHLDFGHAALLCFIAAAVALGRSQRDLVEMTRVVRVHAGYVRRMRCAHRRDDSDREHGEQGQDACDHEPRIGAAPTNVHEC
jgi:hypothetical protein